MLEGKLIGGLCLSACLPSLPSHTHTASRYHPIIINCILVHTEFALFSAHRSVSQYTFLI